MPQSKPNFPISFKTKESTLYWQPLLCFSHYMQRPQPVRYTIWRCNKIMVYWTLMTSAGEKSKQMWGGSLDFRKIVIYDKVMRRLCFLFLFIGMAGNCNYWGGTCKAQYHYHNYRNTYRLTEEVKIKILKGLVIKTKSLKCIL
jgi:hypothetical protein